MSKDISSHSTGTKFILVMVLLCYNLPCPGSKPDLECFRIRESSQDTAAGWVALAADVEGMYA